MALEQAQALLGSDPRRAVEQVRNLLATIPDDAPALRLLAKGLRRLGQVAEAEQAERDAIAASTRNPLHRRAADAVQSGDRARAETILQSLIASDEEDVVALVLLGNLLGSAARHDAAEPLLLKAVALAPADLGARMALAEHYKRSKRPAHVLDQLDQLPVSHQNTEADREMRAAALGALGRQAEEVELLSILIKEGRNPVRYRLRLGHALRGLGRIGEAIAAYREITTQHPTEGTAWWSLANLKSFRFGDKDIAAMERALAKGGGSPENQIRLHFALGKASEDKGQAEQSFHHYDAGNRFRRSASKYDPQIITRLVDNAERLYTPDFFSRRAGAGAAEPDPIFIVGMQRSGSTLVEQILASHPLIEGTAELSDLPAIVRQVRELAAAKGLRLEAYLPTLSENELRDLGQAYLESTRVHRSTAKPLFTDKLPNNWMHVGLIRTILPNAKIVDVRRHPMACGFSNFKQLYAKGLEHSNGLDTMGAYYVDYVRLMRHFDRVQPRAVHRVIYERLVEDIQGEARRLLDYLGVPFDPSVLAFHSIERTVRTISATQVRKPINREGLDQWRAFEQWLDPLKDALGPTLTDWDKA